MVAKGLPKVRRLFFGRTEVEGLYLGEVLDGVEVALDEGDLLENVGSVRGTYGDQDGAVDLEVGDKLETKNDWTS
jgi:hypothetical protein